MKKAKMPEVPKVFKFVKKELKELMDHAGTPERAALFLKQYDQRGWADYETWNIDYQFAVWIVPRLKRFKEVSNGFPRGQTEEGWKKKIDSMIEGFELVLSPTYYGSPSKEQYAKIQLAFKLFGKHFANLWW